MRLENSTQDWRRNALVTTLIHVKFQALMDVRLLDEVLMQDPRQVMQHA